jgi:alpha-tubulin suppressor-like RCC1 family protein
MVPIRVQEVADADDVAAGNNESAIVTRQGELFTFAHNDLVLRREGLVGVIGVAYGSSDFLVAVLYDGGVMGRGNNRLGQLSGEDEPREFIEEFQRIVPELPAVRAVAAGFAHCVYLLTDGRIATMGWNADGQLGDGTQVRSARPIILPELRNVVSIGAGHDFSAAVTERGEVFTWGAGGQLGHGDRDRRLIPTAIVGVDDAVSVSCGQGHAAIVHREGGLSTFGGYPYEDYGELGHGDDIHVLYAPLRVPRIEDAVAVACGVDHTIVQHADNRVSTFGDGRFGQLGLGPGIVRTSVPQFVPGL